MDWTRTSTISRVAPAAMVAAAVEIPITVEGAQSIHVPKRGRLPDPSTPMRADAASLPTIPQMAGFITYFMTVVFDMLLYHTRKKTAVILINLALARGGR